jgi:hypothetical protein
MATQLTKHSGLQFTDAFGVVYLGVQLLEEKPGVGSIWLAIPKFHDLDQGPVTPVLVLNPGGLTPAN